MTLYKWKNMINTTETFFFMSKEYCPISIQASLFLSNTAHFLIQLWDLCLSSYLTASGNKYIIKIFFVG